MPPKKRNDREFLLGLLWSVWWLHSAHGEDTYACDLMIESVGREGVPEMQRLARAEQYHFKRGFWASVHHARNYRATSAPRKDEG